MKILVDSSRKQSGIRAADQGAEMVIQAIEARGEANIILATGASQLDMLSALIKREDIDWSKCTVFHLDEYVGLGQDHSASFVNYLLKRFVQQVSNLRHFEAIDGLADPKGELQRLNAAIGSVPVDVAFIGIGENGHLAFNDPPADFDTGAPYIQVKLDQACREQQVSEGWFPTLSDVPTDAITMSIPHILRSKSIICTVPDDRKAEAVRNCVEGPLNNLCPASALQKHEKTSLFLDAAAASKLSKAYSDA